VASGEHGQPQQAGALAPFPVLLAPALNVRTLCVYYPRPEFSAQHSQQQTHAQLLRAHVPLHAARAAASAAVGLRLSSMPRACNAYAKSVSLRLSSAMLHSAYVRRARSQKPFIIVGRRRRRRGPRSGWTSRQGGQWGLAPREQSAEGGLQQAQPAHGGIRAAVAGRGGIMFDGMFDGAAGQ
jgi:hypothetical protein